MRIRLGVPDVLDDKDRKAALDVRSSRSPAPFRVSSATGMPRPRRAKSNAVA